MKNKKTKLISGILLIALTLSSLALSGCVEEEQVDTPKNIVETASENEDFNTLVDALVAAGLDSTLSDETKEFTVFAPTDEAFAQLDSTYLTNLVQNDLTSLTKILTYHVVPGTVMSTDLSNGMRAASVQGKYIEVMIEGDTVYIDDAMVTTADIECSNGVIHVIDKVLVPKDNIVETAIANDDFETLVTAVAAAGLDSTLSDESAQYTVFAPTDEAFEKLDTAFLNNLVNNDTTNLTKILTYHVVPGIVLSTDLSDNMAATTVEGSDITIQIMDGKVYIDDAMVTTADVECSNGVIHIIDTVITP